MSPAGTMSRCRPSTLEIETRASRTFAGLEIPPASTTKIAKRTPVSGPAGMVELELRDIAQIAGELAASDR